MNDEDLTERLKEIEKKWQRRWRQQQVFVAKSGQEAQDNYYALDMYPYPSGSMHMGHVRNYSLGDANARFRRMRGYNVLYPMGFDSFGLPAENAAIDKGENPAAWTESNIEDLKQQMQRLGFSFDWSRELASHREDYYRWNQWLFLKFYQRGLAYKDEAEVNWCPHCKTVLANEQVVDGQCERCDSLVEKKKREQWFYKITEYSDELLDELKNLDWPDKVKKMQRDWINRSEGTEVVFDIKDRDESLKVFTTRPDTLYGCTFMALAPEHPLAEELAEGDQEISQFAQEIKRLSNRDRQGKRGLETELKAINPVNGEELPIYIAEFVLMEYGTGAIMAVPAHDQRDFDFAQEHGIEIRQVIRPEDDEDEQELEKAYEGEGVLTSSQEFSGLDSARAREEITDKLKEEGKARRTTNYRLKDWNISRQRYWGTPIPIIYCDNCGTVPVPREDLPVELPKREIEIDVEGSPLEHVEDFVNVECPQCGADAKRETDTLDTFVDSSWYFLRFCSPNYEQAPFDRNKAEQWMPVDQYTGGIEHAVLHLLYARFFTKVLNDIDLAPVREPFHKLLNQGMVLLNGEKMSKSRGNVVTPGEVIDSYGADVGRLFILARSSPEKELDWTDEGVKATYELIRNLYNLVEDNKEKLTQAPDRAGGNLIDRYFLSLTHQTVRQVTNQMKDMRYHDAVSQLKQLLSAAYRYLDEAPQSPIKDQVLTEIADKLVLLFAPLIPHLCEELWQELGHDQLIAESDWPEAEKDKIDEKAEAAWELADQISSDVREIKKITGIDSPETIKIIVAAPWRFQLHRQVEADKELSEIMQEERFRQRGEQVASYYQDLAEEYHLSSLILGAEEQLQALREMSDYLQEKLGGKVVIEEEEASQEDKAGKARPQKPAIVLEA